MQSAQTMQSARFMARKVGPTRTTGVRRSVASPVRAAAATEPQVDDLGFKMMRAGVKEASKDTLLTPR